MLFRKKKKEVQKADWEARMRCVAAKYNTTYDAIDHLTGTILEHRQGIIELLKRADPDNDEEKIRKILDIGGGSYYIYIRSMRKKFHEIATHTKEPPFVKLVFIQPFLAMALAEHTGVYNGNIGHIVGNALSDIAEDGKHYDHLKQNPDLIVDKIQFQLEKLGYRYDKEKLRETIRTAVEKAGKIVDKLYNKYQEDQLKALRTALKADNPFPVLKQAGIDIEPELEEFRQFLAEISGKRVEPKGSKAGVQEAGTPETVKLEAQNLLGILSGLKFAGYSHEAVERAIEELDARIEELIDEGNLELLGLYLGFQRLLERQDFEGAGRFLERFARP